MALSNFIVLKTLINHPKTEQIFVIVELITNVYIDQVWVPVSYYFFTLRLLNTTEAEAAMTPKTFLNINLIKHPSDSLGS